MADIPESTKSRKACPFCGTAEPVGGSTLDEQYYVMCRNDDCFGMVGYFRDQQEADEAWNTRAAPPAMDREAVVEAAAISLIVDLCGPGASQSATNVRVVEDHLCQFASTLSADAIRQGEVEVQYEVWQDEFCVASSTDEADARHYLAVYGQDGPVKLMKAVTIRTEIAATPASDGGKA